MRRVHALGLALAASLTTLLAACGGSDGGGPPDLAFVSTRDGDYALFGMAADGGSQERLTEERGDPSSPAGLFFQVEPAWSPDGTRIAFASKREGSFDVYSMAADGTGTRRLTSSGEDEDDPTWSPDGRRIVFSGGRARDLFVMNADGTGVRALVTGDATDTQPAWSPDGRWIAFVRRQPGTPVRELWLVRSDGSDSRHLTSLGATSLAPAWSPDSTRIAFSSNVRNVEFEIYVVGVDGKGFRRLTVSDEDSFEPAWSPDGTKIAFAEGGALYSKAIADDEFADAERLTEAESNDSSPEWRPTSVQKVP